MKLDIFLQKTSNLVAENRLLKLIVLVIGATVLLNTFILQKALHTHRVILVPPGTKDRLEITGDSASDEYLKAFAQYISSLAFTYSPATARRQFDELLTLYTAESFPEAKKLFYGLADTIETTRASNVFYISKLTVFDNDHKIEVTGLKRQYVEDKKIEESQKTYIIEFKIENGRFGIIKISEKGVQT